MALNPRGIDTDKPLSVAETHAIAHFLVAGTL
jgi:hypothetical protein